MPSITSSIFGHLNKVAEERERRSASAELETRVRAIKHFQQRRFSHTYADLLGTPRYGAVARFFLDELYGPHDFTKRDAQLARVVPTMVRLFPRSIVDTVDTLVQLHALSEQLDSLMGANIPSALATADDYVRAWCATGQAELRERQIALTLEVGAALDRLTRNPLIRNSLRLMRGPAEQAGLAELQRFLETGFDTFKAMGGARDFLALVDQREHRLTRALFGDHRRGRDGSGSICAGSTAVTAGLRGAMGFLPALDGCAPAN